jgi:O-antigen ligase
MRRLLKNSVASLLFLLPFNAVWILREPMIGGEKWQYGTIAVHVAEPLLVCMIFFALIRSASSFVKDGGFFSRSSSVVALVFFAWAGTSVLWAPDRVLATYSLFGLLLSVGGFLLVRSAVRTGAGTTMMDALILSALIQSMIGISQFLLQDSGSVPMIGFGSHEAWQAGTSVLKTVSYRFLRAYGTFPHPNIYGWFLSVSLFVLVYRAMSVSSGLRRRLLVIALPVMSLGLLVSFSRSAWAGLVLGLVFLSVSGFRSAKSGAGKRIASVLAATILLSATVFAVLLRDAFFPRFDAGTVSVEGSVTDRIATYRDSLAIFREHPVTGIGIGNSTAGILRSDPNRPVWSVQPAHDVPLLVLSELGVPGLVLFLALLVIIAASARSVQRARVTIGLLLVSLPSFLFDHFLWDSRSGLLLAAMILGAVSSAAVPKKKNTPLP